MKLDFLREINFTKFLPAVEVVGLATPRPRLPFPPAAEPPRPLEAGAELVFRTGGG